MRFVRVVALVAVIAGVLSGSGYGFAVNEFPPPPDGAVDLPYTFVFQPKDGAPPFAFSFKAGELPPGLKIETDGTFHGTPTQPGTFLFDVEATQYCGCPSQRTFIVKIRDKLTITTTALASATLGASYSATLSVTGNASLGMSWRIASGSLPPGLSIGADGTPGDTTITGTPTTAGTFTFTVKVGDTDGFLPDRSTTKQFTIAVVAPFTVAAPAALPIAVVGRRLKTATAATATGGLAPYSWAVTGGAPPPGVSVDPGTGDLVGIPTAAGTYPFTVSVTDADGRTIATDVTVAVAAALDLATKRVRTAKVGRAYRVKLVAKGGLLPRTWKVSRGRLPAGLRLAAKTGILHGKPRKAGRYGFTLTVSDPFPERSSHAFVLKVRP